MSTAPLDRDEQIELMENSKDRLTSRVKKWKESSAVSQILRKPHQEFLMDEKTMIVGSPEHKARVKKLVIMRIEQAKEEINDDTVFSPDQISCLNMAFDRIRAGIKEAL